MGFCGVLKIGVGGRRNGDGEGDWGWTWVGDWVYGSGLMKCGGLEGIVGCSCGCGRGLWYGEE